MVDIDGVISLFGGSPWRRGGSARGVLPLDRRHSPLPFVHGRRSPARARRAVRARLGQRLGGEGQRTPPPPARRCPPGCRSCASTAMRPAALRAHWKLEAIDAYAGGRALAWIDDALNDACHEWAARARRRRRCSCRPSPSRGSPAREAQLLAAWALELEARVSGGGGGGGEPPPAGHVRAAREPPGPAGPASRAGDAPRRGPAAAKRAAARRRAVGGRAASSRPARRSPPSAIVLLEHRFAPPATVRACTCTAGARDRAAVEERQGAAQRWPGRPLRRPPPAQGRARARASAGSGAAPAEHARAHAWQRRRARRRGSRWSRRRGDPRSAAATRARWPGSGCRRRRRG